MPQQATILVADDDPENRTFIEAILRSAGYRVVLVPGGAEALEALEGELPDLLVMDVEMPGCTGLEVLANIRKDDRLKDIPVILVTGREAPDEVLEGFEAGADDYVVKPFNVKELLARIQVHLRAREAARLATLLEFAGAAAHHISQPLTALTITVCDLQETLEHLPEIQDHLRVLRTSADRIRALLVKIRHLREYRTVTYVGDTKIIDLESGQE